MGQIGVNGVPGFATIKALVVLVAPLLFHRGEPSTISLHLHELGVVVGMGGGLAQGGGAKVVTTSSLPVISLACCQFC